MLFGLLGIWLGTLAILLSGFFYTRAMLAALREQALTPSPSLPKTTGRGGTRSSKPNDSPLPAVLGKSSRPVLPLLTLAGTREAGDGPRGAGGEGLRKAGGEGLPG